jgi:hypothetical protein
MQNCSSESTSFDSPGAGALLWEFQQNNNRRRGKRSGPGTTNQLISPNPPAWMTVTLTDHSFGAQFPEI